MVPRSQKQPIDHVVIYLDEGVFTHCKLYVALSRITSVSNSEMILQTLYRQFVSLKLYLVFLPWLTASSLISY